MVFEKEAHPSLFFGAASCLGTDRVEEGAVNSVKRSSPADDPRKDRNRKL